MIRRASAIWHLDSTHDLVKHKVVVIVATCGHRCRIVWLKCSNNNRGNAFYEFSKEAINNNAIRLQVFGDERSKNKLIAKCMAMLHST